MSNIHESILDLKLKIQKIQGIPVQDQHLFYLRKELKDEEPQVNLLAGQSLELRIKDKRSQSHKVTT